MIKAIHSNKAIKYTNWLASLAFGFFLVTGCIFLIQAPRSASDLLKTQGLISKIDCSTLRGGEIAYINLVNVSAKFSYPVPKKEITCEKFKSLVTSYNDTGQFIIEHNSGRRILGLKAGGATILDSDASIRRDREMYIWWIAIGGGGLLLSWIGKVRRQRL